MKRLVFLFLFLVASAPMMSFAGDFNNGTTSEKLYIKDNSGKTLRTYTLKDTDRTLDGTGLVGTVVDGGDHWIVNVYGGTLGGSISTQTGLEICLAGSEAGISTSQATTSIYGNGGVRVCGPGMLHIDQNKNARAINGGKGSVSIMLGAVVGINSLGTGTAIEGIGIRVLASALHVNAVGGKGIFCDADGDVEIGESIVTVGASDVALYHKGKGTISITGSSVHLISGKETALRCGYQDYIRGSSSISVANSVFCALGAKHGIQGMLDGVGTAFLFDNVVGTIIGNDCGIYSSSTMLIDGASTKLVVAGNLSGKHYPGEIDSVSYLGSDISTGQAVCMPSLSSPPSSFFVLNAGSVKLFSPGSCALLAGTNAVMAGKLEIPSEARYSDFQTLFTWQGAISAAETFMGRSLFQSDSIYADFDIAQAFAGVVTPTVALFSLANAKTHTGVVADRFHVGGGEVLVESSNVGIHLGGYLYSKCGYLQQVGGRISVESDQIAIADDDAVDGYTSLQSENSGVYLEGGQLTARGGWNGILMDGYVFQKGGTLEAAATGGYSAGTISQKPKLVGYALSANYAFAIEGGSFIPTAGEVRFAPNTSSEHDYALVYPCNLTVSGTGPVTVSSMVPSWYGVNDLYPVEGKLRFWLPQGTASLSYKGTTYTANGTGTVVAGTNQFVPVGATLEKLSVTGDDTVKSGGRATYTCTASYSDGTSKKVDAEWSLVSGASFGSITTAGVFTAGTTTTEQTVIMQAQWGGLTTTKTVTVQAEAGEIKLATLAISGPSVVVQGESTTYTCTAEYTDGTRKKVSPAWRLAAGTSCGSITSGGEFKANATTENQTATIMATFGGKTGQKIVAVKTSATVETGPQMYMVVDMSGGKNAASWPVMYLDREPVGGWTDEYKTTKLVMRRIAPGSFTMGSPVGELGRDSSGAETQHKVTLTQPYYIGVFEMTAEQWGMAMDKNVWTMDQFGTFPVFATSYEDIRGANFNTVAQGTLLSILREKTGLTFDLPTEAQWEYACRGGTTTALNNGKNLTGTNVCANLAELGQYGYYTNGYQSCMPVGAFLPNNWGLYDMHGNIREWTRDCLDSASAPPEMTDPVGTSAAAVRGGGWVDWAANCRSASRTEGVPVGVRKATIGFRLSCSVSQSWQTVTFKGNEGTPETQSGTYTIGGTYGHFPAVSRTGHEFAGWWTAANGGTQVTATSTVTTDATRTLFAHWVSAGGTQGELRIEGFSLEAANKFTVFGVGETGKTYHLEWSPELSGGWETVGSSLLPQEGKMQWDVDFSFAGNKGFYRVAEGAALAEPKYIVVDMGGGKDAATWPVSKLSDVPEGGWTDEYKTTKIVLRRIRGGTFIMGRPEGEMGLTNEVPHGVTLNQPFWMGVFEVTQRQWELAMGTRPSWFDNTSYYATRPVEEVSYDDIRGGAIGARWPVTHAVDSSSFLGVLRSKTGLEFDLPTEAQWEYTCRAGTITAFNNGKNLSDISSCTNMAEVGRYWYNGGGNYSESCSTSAGTAKVGSYLPNAWGLYDMHGNVFEWCLDWYGDYDANVSMDPVGASEGANRVLRGGGWRFIAQSCRSATRASIIPSDKNYDFGFRLCCPAEVP